MPVIDSFTGKYAFLHPNSLTSFFFDGDEYHSAAAAFEAAKIARREDRVSFQSGNCKPWEARKNGKSIPAHWKRPSFTADEEHIMLAIQREKFKWYQNAADLMATEDAELVYGNLVHDNFWGTCLCQQTEASKLRYGIGRDCTGQGQNMIGKILKAVRDELHEKALPQAA